MNRYIFIEELRKALSGSFSANEIDEHATYYEEFIDMQLKKGKTEEEVLQELGNPRLLAKSINDANGGKNRSNDDGISGMKDNHQGKEKKYYGKSFKIQTWTILIIFLLLVLVMFGLIFSVIALLLRFFLPIIIVVFIVKSISKLSKRN